ncbi:MAG: hypothetical protein C0594_08180 [Marinilabiliales bacterium]|nr:MAG: hypothetical protein C0594_08180 [Marinilabiliales bacterium]
MTENYREILARAQTYCARAERCNNDVVKKLHQWGVDIDLHNQIIENLYANSFLDEQRYCDAFVADKNKFNKWGKIKIRWELKSRNIPERTIDNALESLDMHEYRELVFEEISKKAKNKKFDSKYKLKASLIRFGQQRGYEMELIMPFVEKIISE